MTIEVLVQVLAVIPIYIFLINNYISLIVLLETVILGTVYIFESTYDYDNHRTWTRLSKLQAREEKNGDFYGRSVSLGDNYLVIGAYGDDDMGYDTGTNIVI
jgi:hypothetical protein